MVTTGRDLTPVCPKTRQYFGIFLFMLQSRSNSQMHLIFEMPQIKMYYTKAHVMASVTPAS